jgi:hypothetical protein
VLDDVVAEIAAAPHSAAALTLYALACTLENEHAGYLFKLVKLRDLSAAQRQLAYGLIELAIGDHDSGQASNAAKARMDALIRAG